MCTGGVSLVCTGGSSVSCVIIIRFDVYTGETDRMCSTRGTCGARK